MAISDFSRMTIYISPTQKAQLQGAAVLLQKPAWKVLSLALEQFIASLPKEERQALNLFADAMRSPKNGGSFV